MEQSPRDPATILVINCECGYVIKGDIEVELIANARNHIDEAHPEAELSDEELLAEAKVQPAV
jgi:predicted small metal-binding protein